MNVFNIENIPSLFIKVFGIVLSFIYLFFSFIMIQQVKSMKKTISVQDNGVLLAMVYVNIVLGSLAVFFALFIL